MLSPEHKRRMAAFIVEVGLCSGGTACRGLGLARSTFQYRRRPPDGSANATSAAAGTNCRGSMPRCSMFPRVFSEEMISRPAGQAAG